MDNLVSIVMPAHNNEKYVMGVIQSVLSPTHRDWELLFVDDCWADRTLKIAKSSQKTRRLWRRSCSRTS